MTIQTVTKAMRSALAGAAIMSATGIDAHSAPISGSVEHIQSVSEASQSYERLNAFYTLPAGIGGFTFVEAYHDGTAFGKTNLSKKIAGPLSVLSQTRSINEGFTDTGIGLKVNTSLKSGVKLGAYVVPAWINSDGNVVQNRSILGLSISKDLTSKISVGAFGEMNLDSKNGAEWAYGEGYALYKINKDWSAGYAPALRNAGKGKIVPKVEHRFTVQRRF